SHIETRLITFLLLHCSLVSCVLFLLIRQHPISTLFPYTTLFRSEPRTNTSGGRALFGLGGHPDLPTPCKLRIPESNIRETHGGRSEEHTSELQSRENLVCRLLLEKKNNN